MAAAKSSPLFCPGPCLPGPALGELSKPVGQFCSSQSELFLTPGDSDAAVGCSQLDRPREQHRVGGADGGLCSDTQGGNG